MKVSVWRSHPRRVPLFTVTMMEKTAVNIYRISREWGGGGVNITMISMVTSLHFKSQFQSPNR